MTIEFKCKECGKSLSHSNYYVDEQGNLICGRCAETLYTRCSCGTLIKRSELRQTCLNCDSKAYSNTINGYSVKPIPRFKNKIDTRTNLNNRYFGLEMEYSYVRPELARMLFKDLYNDKMIYNKSDGSLSSGVEIVTNPCDMYSVRKLIKDMSEGFKVIKQVDDHTHNAGIHIHVNKKSISPMARIKLGYLLNNNWSAVDRKFMMYLSGRINSLDSTEIGDNYCTTGTQGSFKMFGKENLYNRHIALNFNNSNTVEFRIYKASADVDTILSYIEMTNLMIEYCDSSGIKDINMNNFGLYILNNSKNKILIDKVNKYFSNKDKTKMTNSYGVNIDFVNDIDEDNLMKLFSNISRCNSISELLLAIDDYKNGIYNNSDTTVCSDFISNTKIYKAIDDKLRGYLIDKIIESVGA